MIIACCQVLIHMVVDASTFYGQATGVSGVALKSGLVFSQWNTRPRLLANSGRSWSIASFKRSSAGSRDSSLVFRQTEATRNKLFISSPNKCTTESFWPLVLILPLFQLSVVVCDPFPSSNHRPHEKWVDFISLGQGFEDGKFDPTCFLVLIGNATTSNILVNFDYLLDFIDIFYGEPTRMGRICNIKKTEWTKPNLPTVSSILLLLYGYLSVLQDWTSTPDKRQNILEYKWFVISFTFVDFAFGSLLAYAANLVKRYRRPKIIVWLVFDSLLLPVNVYLLRKMNRELENSKPLSTDIHLHRVILVHEIYEAIHLIFIIGAINFLAYYKPKQKKYEPSDRPDSVFGPTDPQITTTESRRIRFSESFLQTNTQKSSDVEPSSSTKNQTQLRATISTKFGLYRMSMVPLITAYWMKQFTSFLKPGKNSKSELKRTKALAQFRLTYPDFYSVLVNIRNLKRSKRLKTTELVPLQAVSSLNS